MEKLIYSSHLPLKPLLLPRRHFSPLLRRCSVPLPPLSFTSGRSFSSSGSAQFKSLSVCSVVESCGEVVSSSTPEPAPATTPVVDGSDGVFSLFKWGSLVHRFQSSLACVLGRNFSFGAAIFISVLVTLIIQPFIVSQAYATIQSASRAGGPAVASIGGRLIRTEVFSSAWTGFLAGCLHTLSGPDHLAALAPLSIGRSSLQSAALGALWGCGHDAGQVIFGLLFLTLKDRLQIEVLKTWGTVVVGMTLVTIGVMGIREATEVPAPCVALEGGECEVTMVEPIAAPKKKIGFATFATGIVHGLQPDALMMVLPALALPSRLAGAAFLGMFLLGTVISMGCYTAFLGSFSQALKDRVPRVTEKLTWASSFVAIALGLAIFISQFFGFSLY